VDLVPQNLTLNRTHLYQRPSQEAIYKSVAKFQLGMRHVDLDYEHYVEEALSLVEQCMLRSCGNSRVQGHIEAKQHLNYAKSSGYPWTQIHDEKGISLNLKSQLYNYSQFDKMATKVWEDDLPAGHFTPICSVNGKTEMYSSEKVLKDECRTTYAMDGMTIYIQQRLFGDQNGKLKDSTYDETYSAIGDNPFGFGTLNRANYISFGKATTVGSSLDIKKMESQHRAWFQMRLARMRFRCLSPDEQTPQNWSRVYHLYTGISQCPFIMPDGNSFLKGANGEGGNPSGQLCTSSDNHWYATFCLFLGCVVKFKHPSLMEILHNLHATICGDDINATLSELWAKLWPNFAFDLAEICYDICGTILESANFNLIPWFELEFCSMRFHFMKHPIKHITFAMDHDRVLCSLLQGGTTRDPPQTLTRISNIRVATWGDEKTRKIVDDMWSYFYNTHNPVYKDDPNWELAKRCYLSDDDLLELFYTDQVQKRGNVVETHSLHYYDCVSIMPKDDRTIVDRIANFDFGFKRNSYSDKVGDITEHIPGIGKADKALQSVVSILTGTSAKLNDFIKPGVRLVDEFLEKRGYNEPQRNITWKEFFEDPLIKLKFWKRYKKEQNQTTTHQTAPPQHEEVKTPKPQTTTGPQQSVAFGSGSSPPIEPLRRVGNGVSHVDPAIVESIPKNVQANAAEQYVVEENPGPGGRRKSTKGKRPTKRKSGKRRKSTKGKRKLVRRGPGVRMSRKRIGLLGSGSQGMSRPRPYYRQTRTKDKNGKGSITIEAKDYYQTLTLSTSATAGNKIFTVALHPDSFGVNTRLSKLAQNFERYRFHKCNFHYNTDAPTTVTGQVGAFYEPDVSDASPIFTDTGDAAKRRLAGHSGRVTPVRESAIFPMLNNAIHKDPWYTSSSSAQSIDRYQGAMIFEYMTTPSVASQFEIWIEYSVTLSVPNLDEVAGNDSNGVGSQARFISTGTETKLNPMGINDALNFAYGTPRGYFVGTLAGDSYIGQFALNGVPCPSALEVAITMSQGSGTAPVVTFNQSSNIGAIGHNFTTQGTAVTQFTQTFKMYNVSATTVASPVFTLGDVSSQTNYVSYINDAGAPVNVVDTVSTPSKCYWYVRFHSDTIPTQTQMVITSLSGTNPTAYRNLKLITLGNVHERFAVEAFEADPTLDFDKLLQWHSRYGATEMSAKNLLKAKHFEFRKTLKRERAKFDTDSDSDDDHQLPSTPICEMKESKDQDSDLDHFERISGCEITNSRQLTQPDLCHLNKAVNQIRLPLPK